MSFLSINLMGVLLILAGAFNFFVSLKYRLDIQRNPLDTSVKLMFGRYLLGGILFVLLGFFLIFS
jgi:hypothetical protein